MNVAPGCSISVEDFGRFLWIEACFVVVKKSAYGKYSLVLISYLESDSDLLDDDDEDDYNVIQFLLKKARKI